MLFSSVTLVTFQCDVHDKVAGGKLCKKRQLPLGGYESSLEYEDQIESRRNWTGP
jgi:hypothetical protein